MRPGYVFIYVTGRNNDEIRKEEKDNENEKERK
jgi:hypothetical protein